MKKALIHYFSGTGNTYHMIKFIEDKLKQDGYLVEFSNIEFEENYGEFNLHIFSYPIYGFGTPSIVLRYLKNLKSVQNCKTCIICTSAGFEGQSLVHVSSILKSKGYNVFLSDNCTYPYNWTQIINSQDEETQDKILKEASIKSTELCRKIINFETSLKILSIFNIAWSCILFILFSLIGRRLLGKSFIADSSCTSCRKCEHLCPVHSIKIKNGKPVWDWKCENCQRCINICPSKSIQTSLLRLLVFVSIQIGMIFIVIALNKHYMFPFITTILLYCVLFLITIIIVTFIMDSIQKLNLIKGLFEYSYTKKYRRYTLKNYKKN